MMVNLVKPEKSQIGENSAWPSIGSHKCLIPADMDHGLHLLSPSGSYLGRIGRFARKLTLPLYEHRLCRYYYPTRKRIVKAWIETAETKWPIIIHPFSAIALWWQVIMLITWALLIWTRPFVLAFTRKDWSLRLFDTFNVYCALAGCGVLVCNIGMNFITGFTKVEQGKSSITMNFTMIYKKYLWTYFIFDVVDALPLVGFVYLPYAIGRGWMLIHLIQFARSWTFIEYALNIGYLLKIPRLCIHAVCYLYLGTVTIHWFTCILHVLPLLQHGIYEKEADPQETYIKTMYKVLGHFFLGTTEIRTDEKIALIFVLIIGALFRIIAISFIYRTMVIYTKTPLRFQSLVNEASKYFVANYLTWNMQQRINVFMKHKYHGKFYVEKSITKLMSSHLLNEIYLHSCGHLICTMNLCKHLNYNIVGEMIMTFEPVFYHTGDVVFAVNELCEGIYFISFGKLASYTENGMEVVHYTDGQIVGLLGFHRTRHVWTVVAIEPTEAFIWRPKHVETLIKKYPNLAKFIKEIYYARRSMFNKVMAEKRYLSYSGPNANVYMQLGNKKILEQRRVRDPEAEKKEDISIGHVPGTNSVYQLLTKVSTSMIDTKDTSHDSNE